MLLKSRTSAQDKLEHDMRNVVSEVEDLLRSVGAQGSAVTQEAQDRVAHALEGVQQRLRSLDAQVRAGTRQAAEATDDYVHARPWQSMAVAAAVGLLAGVLIARR
jgi:ElaB/YqjD/DUF883 family membrane-anchored ribosome-binding protein